MDRHEGEGGGEGGGRMVVVRVKRKRGDQPQDRIGKEYPQKAQLMRVATNNRLT